jgi:hypothetical protein
LWGREGVEPPTDLMKERHYVYLPHNVHSSSKGWMRSKEEKQYTKRNGMHTENPPCHFNPDPPTVFIPIPLDQQNKKEPQKHKTRLYQPRKHVEKKNYHQRNKLL